MSPVPFYRKKLKEMFEQRLDRNPRYSMRAFATSLQINSSACSQLLAGKRVPSVALAERLMERLNLDALEREAFLQSIGREKIKAGLQRVNPKLRTLAASKRNTEHHTRRDLSIDAYQTVARWYYYAILELIKLPSFQESPKWIANELGITETEAELALTRLIELQMIAREDGKLVKTYESFYTADAHLTSSAHRRRQKEILQKSIDALEHRPISERNHSGMTVAINPALIPEAKKKITIFLQELSDFLESGGPKEVYEMHLSLFSLQEPKQTGVRK